MRSPCGDLASVHIIASLAEAIQIGSWQVRVLPDDAPIAPSALVVDEEDRFRVLSAPPVIPERSEHPIRVMTALWNFEPCDLGSIVEVHARRWLAVVHDLDAERSLTPEVAGVALRAVLDRAGAAGFDRLALRPWGVRHGPWPLDVSLDLLLEALLERWRSRPRRLDLRVSDSQVDAAQSRLRR